MARKSTQSFNTTINFTKSSNWSVGCYLPPILWVLSSECLSSGCLWMSIFWMPIRIPFRCLTSGCLSSECLSSGYLSSGFYLPIIWVSILRMPLDIFWTLSAWNPMGDLNSRLDVVASERVPLESSDWMLQWTVSDCFYSHFPLALTVSTGCRDCVTTERASQECHWNQSPELSLKRHWNCHWKCCWNFYWNRH